MGRRLDFDISDLHKKKLSNRALAYKRLAHEIRARADRMSAPEIARELNRHVESIRRCARRHNIKWRQGTYSLIQAEKKTGYHRSTILKVAIRVLGKENVPCTAAGQYRFSDTHLSRITNFLRENSLAALAGEKRRKKLRRLPNRKGYAIGSVVMGQEILGHFTEVSETGQARLMLQCRCRRCLHEYSTHISNFAAKRSEGCKKCCMKGVKRAKLDAHFQKQTVDTLTRIKEKYPEGAVLFGRARVLDVFEKRETYTSGRSTVRRYIRFRCPEEGCACIGQVDSREAQMRRYDMCQQCIRTKVLYPNMKKKSSACAAAQR